MTRQRLAIGVVGVVAIGALFLWWTCTPDQDAIAELLADVRDATEAGDLEPALPAFRRDFTFGAAGSSLLTYDELVDIGNRELRRADIDEVEVRNVDISIDGDHATVTATVRLQGSGADLRTGHPLPLQLELVREQQDERYRGWRLYRGKLRRLTEN